MRHLWSTSESWNLDSLLEIKTSFYQSTVTKILVLNIVDISHTEQILTILY